MSETKDPPGGVIPPDAKPLPTPPMDPDWKPGLPIHATSESELPQPKDAPESSPPTNGFLWFKKVLNNMAYFVNGKPVQFEALDRNLGVLKIASDDPLASALTASARANGGKGRGGIVAIDEATFFELKKNLPFRLPEPKSSQQGLRVAPTLPPKNQKLPPRGDGGVVVAKPFARAHSISSGDGVAVGGVGTVADSGKAATDPIPAPAPPGEFRPATGKKHMKMPVIKKASGRSLVSLNPTEE